MHPNDATTTLPARDLAGISTAKIPGDGLSITYFRKRGHLPAHTVVTNESRFHLLKQRICAAYGVTNDELLGTRRNNPKLIEARFILIWIGHKIIGLSRENLAFKFLSVSSRIDHALKAVKSRPELLEAAGKF